MRRFEKGKVSIVTPCYNGEKFLGRYFDSICKQTYEKVEVIFVNDGSNDNTEDVSLAWKSKVETRGYEFLYVLQKENMGAAAAINAGLSYVTGEFLIWPDCDDILMPTSIERRVQFLNQNTDYAMVRSDFVSVNETKPGLIIGKGSDWADIKNESIFDDLIFERTYLTSGCYMVRSSILFERIPGGEIYWENKGGQNWQLLLPTSYMNKTGYIDEPLYKYFIRDDSHSHLIEGAEYDSHKNKTYVHHEILSNVLNSFHLLSDERKSNYLIQVDIKYTLKRLDLALRYNIYSDAVSEMQRLNYFNVDPGISRKLLYYSCRFGFSKKIIQVHLFLTSMYRKLNII
ncbi:MAG: glycosyl transferase family 2 [Methanolobus sp. T82-4]|nr:MAG: glycosyl transferase family 2 [Methanolobus sp. T82-4]